TALLAPPPGALARDALPRRGVLARRGLGFDGTLDAKGWSGGSGAAPPLERGAAAVDRALDEGKNPDDDSGGVAPSGAGAGAAGSAPLGAGGRAPAPCPDG